MQEGQDEANGGQKRTQNEDKMWPDAEKMRTPG